jgi:hypothetical protein
MQASEAVWLVHRPKGVIGIGAGICAARLEPRAGQNSISEISVASPISDWSNEPRRRNVNYLKPFHIILSLNIPL